MHPFSKPGLVDLTADVDFSQCRRVALHTAERVQQAKRARATLNQHMQKSDDATIRTQTQVFDKVFKHFEGKVSAHMNASTDVDSLVTVLPLQTQADFLMSMGIIERTQQLLSLDSTTEEEADMLFNSLQMLVDPQHMGHRFKVLTLMQTSAAQLLQEEQEKAKAAQDGTATATK